MSRTPRTRHGRPSIDPASRPHLIPSARHLVPTALATAACATAGSLATRESVDSAWFEALDKPGFYPPTWAFPAVWSALFADIAVTTAKALDALPREERAALLRSLALNLGLNAAWCWTFFGRREVALSVPVAAALTISSARLVRRVGRAKARYGVALAPYPAWCAFATVLSLAISARNPEG